MKMNAKQRQAQANAAKARDVSWRSLLNIKPSGSCPGGKLRYADKETAKKALVAAKRKRELAGQDHVEKRVYLCDEPPWNCRGWHLTSKARRPE
jgi:hypothetical protein